MTFALNHFIYDHINMALILCDQQILGAHTDVILFEPTVITTFKWTHPGACPMGNDTPCLIQCPNCHRLKTTSPKQTTDLNVIHLKCESALGRIHTAFLLTSSGARDNFQRMEWIEELGFLRLRNLI